jgi:hypothetical protein
VALCDLAPADESDVALCGGRILYSTSHDLIATLSRRRWWQQDANLPDLARVRRVTRHPVTGATIGSLGERADPAAVAVGVGVNATQTPL